MILFQRIMLVNAYSASYRMTYNTIGPYSHRITCDAQISKMSSPGLAARLFSAGLTASTLFKRGRSLSDWKISSYPLSSSSPLTIRPLLFVGFPASSTGLSSTERRGELPRKGGNFNTNTPGTFVFSLPQSAPLLKKALSFSSK